MFETNEKRSQENGRTVLENLRNLRFLEGDEKDFWTRLLFNASVLSKSPVVLFMTRESGGWTIRHEYYGNGAGRNDGDSFLALALNLAERARDNGFAYEPLNMAFPPITLPYGMVVRLDVAEAYEGGILFVVLDRGNIQHFNDLVIRMQLISDIPLHYYIRRQASQGEKAETGGEVNRLLANALETTNKVMEKDKFLLSCMTLVNEIAYRFHCSQVSMGWKKGAYVRTVAISHLEGFKKHAEAVSVLEGVFEEACEQNETVVHPKIHDRFVVDRMHELYFKKRNLHQLVTVPIVLHDRVVAALICEKPDSALAVSEIDTIKLIVNQVAPWLNVLYRNDRWLGGRLALGLRENLGSLLSMEHSLLKAAALLLAAALVYGSIAQWNYRVEGSATLKTDSISYISAPYEGLISAVKVHEGNEVKKGEFLLEMDKQELLLKESQASANIIRYTREAEKNRANEALADMKVAQSRIDEVQAELDKIRYYIAQANIRSQLDGIVVEGDNQKLLGSPVSKGDILLKIAKLDAMYVQIKISERDIDHIPQKGKGQLILLSRPFETFGITLDKLIPMAEVDQREGNIFVVKATIDGEPQAWWRPGMSGIAKIDAGERTVLWILTHRFTEFLRIYFWW